MTGWMDDSVFLRRNDVEDEAWGPNMTPGGPGQDVYTHRAFTTGRRRGLPPQQQQPLPQLPGHPHSSTSRKVIIIIIPKHRISTLTH